MTLAVLSLAMLLGGCSPNQLIVRSLADELATQSQGSETDLDLLRDAAPFHLKFSELVLRQNPGHVPLAEAVAAEFTQYSYAFVAFEAEQIESRDLKAAERLRQRAAKLYQRAHLHAMAAMELASPGFRRSLTSPQAKDWPVIKPEQLGLAYWAAASWGAWISLSKDDADVVADLPLAVRLAHLAWAADPTWGQGSLTGLLGTFEASRPDGSQKLALTYFDQSIVQSAGRSAGPLVSKAEGYAQTTGDRALYEQLLRQALAIKDASDSPRALENEVMRRRARGLLDTIDDRF